MISTASVSVKKSELKNLSDDQLMALVAADSNDALAMLMKRYEQRTKAFARKLVTDGYLADEIVNKAFTRIWQHRHNFCQLRGTFKAWLMQIVRNLSFNATRDYQRREGPCLSLEGLLEFGELPSPKFTTPSAEMVAVSWLTSELILSQLIHLPSHLRDALILFMNDRSYQEIAESLGITLGTVSSRVSRARAFLSQEPIMRELLAA